MALHFVWRGGSQPSKRRCASLILPLGIATLGIAILGGCGGASESRSLIVEPSPLPERDAVEDASLRGLFMSVAEKRVCESLQGSYVGLPDVGGPSGRRSGAYPSAGRLRLDRCAITRHGDTLSLSLAGDGWTWVEQTQAGPAGTSFLLRGHVRFQTAIELEGALDVAYAERSGVVSLWMSPKQGVAAKVVPTYAVPVAPEGGWSHFVAAVGGLFGPSIEERARPMVEEEGSLQMSKRLASGFTFTLDLCTSQADSMVGALGNGEVPERPFPPDDRIWLDNQRVRLRAGGIDAAGPFQTEDDLLQVEIDVEEGADLEAGLYCEAEANAIVQAFLRGEQPKKWPRALVKRRLSKSATPHLLEADARSCKVVLLSFSHQPDPVVFRYRSYERGAQAESLVQCRSR